MRFDEDGTPHPQEGDDLHAVVEHLKERLAQARRMIDAEQARANAIEVDLHNAEIALRAERRRCKTLQNKLDHLLEEHVSAGDAKAVFEYWKEQVRPKAKGFKGKRQENVARRLADGYTVEDLMQAVDGARIGAFEKDGKRYDDLELICRDPTHVERFMDIASRARRVPDSRPALRQVLLQTLEERDGHGSVMWDEAMNWSIAYCPKCMTTSHRTLRIDGSDKESNSLVWCENCDVTTDQLINILNRGTE